MTRRLGLAVAITVLFSVALAQPSLANQGGLRKLAYSYQGSRASLTGGATIGNATGVIASVRVQGNNEGLYQAGETKQDSINSDCGGPNFDGFFAEWHPDNGGMYKCNVYTGGFGSDHVFAVVYTSNGYIANLDGSQFDPPSGAHTLGFADAQPFAVGEYVGNTPNSYDFTWGPSGETPWQYYDPSDNQWHTTNQANPFNQGGWTVGDPPSPFHIKR